MNVDSDNVWHETLVERAYMGRNLKAATQEREVPKNGLIREVGPPRSEAMDARFTRKVDT